MKSRPRIPVATYRLQLNRKFTFVQATEIVPYLAAIGISHCYLSPCLKARPGSLHGYDIVDHNSFNPEIGSAEEFDRFVSTLHQHGMGLVLDIVPNHMGVMGSDNAWWLDVLENGESSVYAGFFDIDWQPLKDELRGKVLVPVLHDHYGSVLESGALKLAFHAERGEFHISYHDHRFPIDPREYPRILQVCAGHLAASLGEQDTDLLELQSLITAFGHLPGRQEASSERIIERNRDKEIHKRRLAELCSRSPKIAACISQAVRETNGNPADPASFEHLHELIKAQTFRLANWRVASDDINYRRFFDTNDLAALCMEQEAVFQATHGLVLRLIAENKIDGLRIDHPDGLYDPAQYFERLQQAIAEHRQEPFYIVIEKILTGAERLPQAWPVSGTTGYDFENLVNGLFVDTMAAIRMERIYRKFLEHEVDVDDLTYRCRKLIIRVALASELNVLASQLTRIALAKRHTCDFTLNSLRDALTEVVASFPVYRTYVSRCGVSQSDASYVQIAVALAKRRSPAADTTIFDFVRDVLITRIAEGQDTAYRNAVTAFAMKFQQFSSPVMAKGLEDTAFYRYHRLISLNDVGADLHRFGTTPAEFHLANQDRACHWPHAMLATSTHDSKRSEDVRSRVNVLSEMSAEWRLHLRDWRRFNRGRKFAVNDQPVPSPNEEYLLYQTLIGAWPLEPLDSDTDWSAFRTRIDNYMLKAIREAKRNTSWINPNEAYEAAMSSFIQRLLTPGERNRFLDDFLPFQRRVARIGIWNSLSQTLLKLTCPGVPDIYQGNDLWDLSLVDPDNRRPVDYVRRKQAFESIRNWGNKPSPANLASLLAESGDGRIKLFLTWRVLCFRQQHARLFQEGEYLPLEAVGEKGSHVIAFARKLGAEAAIVIAPRQMAGLLHNTDQPPLGLESWNDTRVLLPFDFPAYRNEFTGALITNLSSALNLSESMAQFPVALLSQESAS